jgi:2Fe-2S ferredoxin
VPKVTVMPLGVAFEVEDGESVFHAAEEAGYRWPTVCGGMGSCRTCYMWVLEGADNFEEPDDWEQEGLEDLASTAPVDAGVRLACQARVHGDATVRKTGVKPPRPV